MTAVIDISGTLGAIDIGATGLSEIMQNVRTILATAIGSVVLDRAFGVDTSILDEPAHLVQARRAAQVIEAVEKFEPRVTVTRVTWQATDAADGVLSPTVQIRIKDGVQL